MIAVGLLLPVLAVAVAVWIVRVSRHAPDQERAGWSLRRLLQYLFLLVALFSGASGVTRVLATALPAGRRIAGSTSDELALGLSLTLVAVPIWVVLWRVVRRRLVQGTEERASAAWSLYLAAAATVSLIIAYVNLVEVGAWALGAADFQGQALAAAVVWGAVWGGHTWLLRRPQLLPTGRLSDLAVLAGSAVGIVALAVGAGGVLYYGFGQIYHAVAGPALIEAATIDALRHSLVITILAAAVWWWYWLRQAVHVQRSSSWQVYLLALPTVGGLLTAVGSAAVALHAVAQWFIGEPDAVRAAVHFATLPASLAAMVVGTWAWRYHRAVLGTVDQRRGEPERAYEYLVAAVGLLAAVAGVTMAVVAAIEAVAPAPLAAVEPHGRNTLAAALTLLVIGAPLWWAFWRRLRAVTGAGERAELESPSRRAHLFVLFGLAGLAAAISIVVVLFVVLRDLLEVSLAATVVYDLRVALALTLTAGAVSAYHWTVHQEDRAAAPRQMRMRQHVLLVSADGRMLADRVAADTGATIRTLHRLDVAAAQIDAEHVTAAILASPHDRLLVTVDEDGTVHTIPYEAG
jgi:hypothetical protein